MSYQPETFDDLAEGSLEDFDAYLDDFDDLWDEDEGGCWCGGDCMSDDDDDLDDDLIVIFFGESDDDEQ
jgi:hypothetical protein